MEAPGRVRGTSREANLILSCRRTSIMGPPVGGTFYFEILVTAPLPKTCPKMVLSHKGGSLCVKDVFAKKIFWCREKLRWGRLRSATASIQNEVSRSLISQDFLPKGDTNRRFRRTLRNKCFSGASDTTADQRAGGTFIFEEENRATFLPQRRGASGQR